MRERSKLDDEVGLVIATDATVVAQMYEQLRRFAAVAAPVEFDPDDLVQDALERALRRGSLTSLVNPKAYLFRTILNSASNQRRGLGRARKAMTRMAERDGAQPSYPSDVSELLRVPARQRAMLFLREVEGFTYAEIAELLGSSEQAVRKASQRARTRLKADLQEDDQR